MATPLVGVQSYLPTSRRRQRFTPGEELAIGEGQSQWMPQIFTSQADSPAVDLANPDKNAAMWAAPAAIAGGVAGRQIHDSTLGGAVGATALGALTYLLARRARQASNDNVIERMRRIPANGTRRDVESDPVYQAEIDRATQLQAARLQ